MNYKIKLLSIQWKNFSVLSFPFCRFSFKEKLECFLRQFSCILYSVLHFDCISYNNGIFIAICNQEEENFKKTTNFNEFSHEKSTGFSYFICCLIALVFLPKSERKKNKSNYIRKFML